jgi:pimeloyl-ACP methyl ester carboxylesterase
MRTQFADVGAVTLAYETFGDRQHPPVVMIMGLGAQMIVWPEELCRALAEAGHFVVRFDNRDAGESTHMHAAGMPDLRACLEGDASSASYDLVAMAADTIGLLDALGIESAHLVGASMGGMIAQTAAARHPERVRSLTSIMSTTGERSVSQSTPEAAAVLTEPAARSREEAVERAPRLARVIGSPGFPLDEDAVRARAGLSWDRGVDPPGFARQFAAIVASGDRTEMLRSLRVPALVFHGEDDPLLPVAGGRATAAAIEGAELITVPGMGHDLPRAVWPRLVDAIGALVARAESERVPAAT